MFPSLIVECFMLQLFIIKIKLIWILKSYGGVLKKLKNHYFTTVIYKKERKCII